MAGRKKRKAQDFADYLSKWGLDRFTYAINPSMYLDDRLYAFPGKIYGKYHELKSILSFVRALKRIKGVKLWTGVESVSCGSGGYRQSNRPKNQYQVFDSFDAFREYCLVLKLSGL